MPRELAKGVYWVGAIDWNLRDFHGYITGRGATYNSYLIVDEKITLIDTVKEPFFKEMLGRIVKIVDPARIDYLVCNHIEKDHSSSLPLFHAHCPNVKIFATDMARKGLERYYGAIPLSVVKTGDSLALGAKTLQFIETPMVHWPDSMFSYLPENKILFSMDGFGQHIATDARFDDESYMPDVMHEAAKYYANLLVHLAPLIRSTLQKISELQLDIAMIAPSHGIIWRRDPQKIIRAYDRWSRHVAEPRVAIIYDTMWKSTEVMANILVDAIADNGLTPVLLKLRENHRSDIMTEILQARGLLIGSPTLHRQLFPTVADMLCYMTGLKPQQKAAAAFGSYGWSGESVQLITDALNAIKLDVIEPGVRANYLPDKEDTAQLRQLASMMAEKVKAYG